MRELGRIKQLQVQRSTLKLEAQLFCYYDPAPLQIVEALELTPEGVFGITESGRRIVDVHHVHHPDSHNHNGKNGVSVGFTHHYATMREQFGPHLTDGIAGENILIETDTIIGLNDLGQTLAIRSEETGMLFTLTNLKVAAPCVEFSQFSANHGQPMEAQQLKATLQFLNAGRRGFYATAVVQDRPMIVRAGDMVLVMAEQ